MPRYGLEMLKGARHRERQDEPVRLRQGQCALDGCEGSALVAEFAVRERCQEVSVNHRHVADYRSHPVEDILDHGESGGWVAPGQADGPASISELAEACQVGIECCQRR